MSPTDLTFANTGGGGKFGALAQAPSLMDNFANWSNIEGEGTWNISNANTLETGTYYQRTGTVRISQPLSNFNKSVVIEADTIEINGNITGVNPSGGYTKLRDLPQLVLKADTIIVGQSLQILTHGYWREKISTCGAIPSTTYYSGLNTSTCNTTLTVNGPIQTESLYLRRTAGAEGNNSAALSTAAEKLTYEPMLTYGHKVNQQNLLEDRLKTVLLGQSISANFHHDIRLAFYAYNRHTRR